MAGSAYLAVNATDTESGGADERVGPGLGWMVASAVGLGGAIAFWVWSDEAHLETTLAP